MNNSRLCRLALTGVLTICFWLVVQHSTAQHKPEKPKHTLFLIGNTGDPESAFETFDLLEKQLSQASKDATLIFLGDNLYPRGLPDKNHPHRKALEAKMIRQLDLIKKFRGKSYILAGDCDWDKGGVDGWQQLQNQQDFVEEYLDDEDVFALKAGYPGPLEIKIDNGVYLILFDMQWMLHRFNKPLQDHPLEYHNALDVLVEIDELLQKHKNHDVIVASHHPIHSYGKHGGKFSLKQHIFPLTDLNPGLYIPLPLVGSLYPALRSLAGAKQDIAQPSYKTASQHIESLLKQYNNIVHVSAHEKSLQHIQKEGVDYIISGTGSSGGFIKNGKYAKYVSKRTGFSKIVYEKSGERKLEFWAADQQSRTGEKIYEKVLYEETKISTAEETYPRADFSMNSKQVVASNQYKASAIKKAILGGNYRDVWSEKTTVGLFDITKEKGGLTPIQMGGGLQTKSLRLEAKDGKQYVVRTVEKYAYKSLPDFLQKTVAATILQDQISASHPYAALIIPPLADATGIYHTNPKLFYVPDDGAFGKYRETFANSLVLFEERPDGDWSEADFFGNSKEIVSSPKVIKSLKKDNDNRVDQSFVLKSRLFDMVIADWDRHEDQWRWASYKEKDGRLYKPIPRDRDQAMFMNEGFLPKIASRKWAVPKVEGFKDKIRWSPGFNFNAKYFDRMFLCDLSKPEWLDISKELKEQLTDEAIEEAVKVWPEEIFNLSGENTISTFKGRRDNLEEAAIELYEYMAKEVEILGSDKKELVTIEKISEEELKVTIQKISKKGNIEKTLYNRTFLASETKEVRIYGFGGNDIFKITGKVNNKIKVRIIGGEGEDQIIDESINSKRKKNSIYDNKSTRVESSKFKSKLSDLPGVNRYDKYGYMYDVLMPIGYFKANADDGLFLGGGFIYTKYKWRKKPFGSKHFLTGDFAAATGAFNVKYVGNYTDVLAKWDLDLLANIQSPYSVDNFFGLGNESVYDFENQSIEYYRVRFENNLFRATLSYPLGGFGKFSAGLQHQGFEVENRSGKFIDQVNAGGVDTNNLFDHRRFYTGLYSAFQYDSRDNLLLTTKGIYWKNEFLTAKGLNDQSSNLTKLSSELSWYFSFDRFTSVTLASRTGWSHNLGQFEFYNANKLGGISNLRGYRRTRFYGQTSFYQNIDLRIKLFSFQSYLLPGNIGLLGFYDVGRVWLENEDSDKWHKGVGAGIWISPLGKAVISLNLAFSDEETLPFVQIGFFF